jgi:biotin carboxylase
VLFPTHDQAFLFARRRERIPPSVGLAIADFQSFLQVRGKAALVRTLAQLSIPQPASRIIRTEEELLVERGFPIYLKLDYGTASTGLWLIHTIEQLRSTGSKLKSGGLLSGHREFVVQEAVQGALELVQAVFDRGKLVAIHGLAFGRCCPGKQAKCSLRTAARPP